MISERDIQDWVHTAPELISNLKKAEPDQPNLSFLCNEAADYISLVQKAVENLYSVKGRYHTELAATSLFKLFGLIK